MSNILMANLLEGVALMIDMVLEGCFWIIVASAIVSWVNADPWNPIVRTLRTITQPVYSRVRKTMPFLSGKGIDFTPMVLIMAIYFLDAFLVRSMRNYAFMLKNNL
ncbi:MAG: YggT family protein [Candidatus Lindowbacteria bacterium]|nr:YggT family protein [Candidatus Lindowbacteria bacterium]